MSDWTKKMASIIYRTTRAVAMGRMAEMDPSPENVTNALEAVMAAAEAGVAANFSPVAAIEASKRFAVDLVKHGLSVDEVTAVIMDEAAIESRLAGVEAKLREEGFDPNDIFDGRAIIQKPVGGRADKPAEVVERRPIGFAMPTPKGRQ